MAEPGLRQLKPIRLFEQAVEQIQTLIMDGHLQPGDRLPTELELSATLDVSRASVREALRALESKGLIEVRSGAGTFVAPAPSSFHAMNEAVQWLVRRQESLLHLLQVREAMESLTVSLAADSASDKLLIELRQVVQEQRELSGTVANLDRQVELDVRFHELVAQASGNTIAEGIVGAIVRAFCDSNRAVLYLIGNMEKTLSEHQRIIDALASRNPDQGEAAIRAHIARVRTDIQSIHPEGEAAKSGQ